MTLKEGEGDREGRQKGEGEVGRARGGRAKGGRGKKGIRRGVDIIVVQLNYIKRRGREGGKG